MCRCTRWPRVLGRDYSEYLERLPLVTWEWPSDVQGQSGGLEVSRGGRVASEQWEQHMQGPDMSGILTPPRSQRKACDLSTKGGKSGSGRGCQWALLIETFHLIALLTAIHIPTLHSFQVYNSVVFSCTELCNHHPNNLQCFYSSQKETHCPLLPFPISNPLTTPFFRNH